MSLYFTVLVGHICDTDSFLAKNAPYCVEKFKLPDNDTQVLLGTVVEEELDSESLQFVMANKNKIVQNFAGYKTEVRNSSKQKEFSSEAVYNQWLDDYEQSVFDVVAVTFS